MLRGSAGDGSNVSRHLFYRDKSAAAVAAALNLSNKKGGDGAAEEEDEDDAKLRLGLIAPI